MRQIWSIACYEVRHIFKDPIIFLMVFLIPLGYVALFGAVYVSGVLSDIPTAVVDLDHSRLSREVVRAFEHDPHFKIVEGISTYPALELGMKTGSIRAGIVIPENYERDVALHHGTKVLAIYDASNLIWGYNTRRYLMEALNQINARHAATYLAGLGMTQKEITDVLDTVSCNTEVWYNPTFSYANFYFMGLVMMVLHQLGLLAVGLTVTREKERNCWLQYLAVDLPGWKIFLGKAVPYFLANFFNYALLLWFCNRFVHVKMWGSLGLVILLGLLFELFITAFGFFISSRAGNSLQVTRCLMLLSVPMFIISGFTWPKTHIPPVINLLAGLLPYNWMAMAYRLVTIKELGLPYIYQAVLALGLMAALSVGLSLSLPRRRTPPAEQGVTVFTGTAYPQRF